MTSREPVAKRPNGTPQLELGAALPIVAESLAAPGRRLDADTRAWSKQRFGRDFSDVRIHADGRSAAAAASVGASAYTVDRDIVFGADRYRPDEPAGKALLAHELAHVVAESDGRGAADTSRLEVEADVAGGLVRASSRTPVRMLVGGRTLHRRPFGDPTPTVRFAMLLALDPLTKELAKEAFEAYKKIAPASRATALGAQFNGGEIAKLLRAIPKSDAIEMYPNEVREMLRFVEETSTRDASAKSDAQMADIQAKFQIAQAQQEATASAAAKAPVGTVAPKPTPKDVEAAREARVAKSSITPVANATWDTMPKATQDAWLERARKVVVAVVAFAQKSFAELKLSAANFKADFAAIEKRGVGVLAFDGGSAALRVAVFGFEFVRAAEADPAYVVSTVVHELFGHREYGAYGSEYHLKLYDEAQKKIPGYVKPAEGTKARTKELDAYAYQETEISALLRSLPYDKQIDPKDAAKALVGYKPVEWAQSRIAIIKKQWAPELAAAIVRGLYQRLLLDPRISGPAINAFRDGVRTAFTADEAKAILK